MSDSHLRNPRPDTDTPCFHCGLPLPDGDEYGILLLGQRRRMCCAGCQAVAEAILAAGAEDYYRFRTAEARQADDPVPGFLQGLGAYDEEEVQGRFVRRLEGDEKEASLILEGIVCPACVWVNERCLEGLDGVLSVQVNYTTRRARVRWDDGRLKLSQILEAIHQIGYVAHPYDPRQQQQLAERERRTMLRQLGLAGVMGMQVMMIAVALYVGEWRHGMDEYRGFFRYLSLFLTLPVVLYSARAFFIPAWRDLRRLKPGMDVPVSLGISLAFVGSARETLFPAGGHVYYDSVVMFVFFLLLGRYFELMARKRAGEAMENLVTLTPATAIRLLAEGGQEAVPVARLVTGDRVLVRAGEAIPVDGRVLEGESSCDESLLTGEGLPLRKTPGMAVIAGSINIESPLQVEVEHIGQETVLAHILRILERAQTEKPALTRIADRIASWFVVAILLLSVAVAWYWWQNGGGDWFAITLAVLVVTCPCALSLATPAAVTTASGALVGRGLLTANGDALETLAQATHFVFDKTGTLTQGRFVLDDIQPLGDGDAQQALAIAAALESHSEHPLARAITQAARAWRTLPVSGVCNHPGLGLQGWVAGREYLIGSAAFIRDHTGLDTDVTGLPGGDGGHTRVILAERRRLLCLFRLSDPLREGARELVSGLKAADRRVLLVTGDHADAAQFVAAELGLDEVHAGQAPADKLARVRELQRQGAIVAMLGDGINDAPVLAGAEVSVAVGASTQLARASADLILMAESLLPLRDGLRVSLRMMRVIRQNIAWAITYNIIAVPAAALGYLAPWMAAIGMSLSSLLVVLNSLRLCRGTRT